jgi:hypothetical protein
LGMLPPRRRNFAGARARRLRNMKQRDLRAWRQRQARRARHREPRARGQVGRDDDASQRPARVQIPIDALLEKLVHAQVRCMWRARERPARVRCPWRGGWHATLPTPLSPARWRSFWSRPALPTSSSRTT